MTDPADRDIERQREIEANEDALREELQWGDWRDEQSRDLGIPRSGEF